MEFAANIEFALALASPLLWLTLGVIFLQDIAEAPLEVLYQTYVSETDACLSKEEMVRKIEPIIYKRIMSPTWRGVIRRCIYGIIDEESS